MYTYLQWFCVVLFFWGQTSLSFRLKVGLAPRGLGWTLHSANLLWNELWGSFQCTIRKSLISGFWYVHHCWNDCSLGQSGHKSHKNRRSRGFLAKQQQKEISQLEASITEEKRLRPNSSKCSWLLGQSRSVWNSSLAPVLPPSLPQEGAHCTIDSEQKPAVSAHLK